jgi:site-specific recombinase XerC
MPLQFRKQESKKLTESNRSTQDYLFDKEDLAKMALAGNLKERYVLLVGKSIGLRASDFLSLTYGTFRSLKLDNDAPLSLGETGTGKEKIRAYPFLDSDAIPIIKAWLDSHKDAKDSDKTLFFLSF